MFSDPPRWVLRPPTSRSLKTHADLTADLLDPNPPWIWLFLGVGFKCGRPAVVENTTPRPFLGSIPHSLTWVLRETGGARERPATWQLPRGPGWPITPCPSELRQGTPLGPQALIFGTWKYSSSNFLRVTRT